MVVRIRLPLGTRVGRKTRKNASLASVAGSFVAMLAISCLVLALWRLTSDLGWTQAFVIATGILSHSQVWLAITVALALLAFRLLRYGRLEEPAERLEPQTVHSLEKARSTAASR